MTHRPALSLFALVVPAGTVAATDRVSPKDAVPHITTTRPASTEVVWNLADLRVGREGKAP